MIPGIKMLSEKKLVGKQVVMSAHNQRVGLLWQDFMPRRKEIVNTLTNDLISLARYPKAYFTLFNPQVEFERWATVEVSSFENIPDGMNSLVLPGGLYAVFYYKGLSTDRMIFQYIFEEWLPKSGYLLDSRPHFEILGSKYKNNDPTSEEEIWIPIKKEN